MVKEIFTILSFLERFVNAVNKYSSTNYNKDTYQGHIITSSVATPHMENKIGRRVKELEKVNKKYALLLDIKEFLWILLHSYFLLVMKGRK